MSDHFTTVPDLGVCRDGPHWVVRDFDTNRDLVLFDRRAEAVAFADRVRFEAGLKLAAVELGR